MERPVSAVPCRRAARCRPTDDSQARGGGGVYSCEYAGRQRQRETHYRREWPLDAPRVLAATPPEGVWNHFEVRGVKSLAQF